MTVVDKRIEAGMANMSGAVAWWSGFEVNRLIGARLRRTTDLGYPRRRHDQTRLANSQLLYRSEQRRRHDHSKSDRALLAGCEGIPDVRVSRRHGIGGAADLS